MSGCDGCNHKGFREMIKSPYGYSGEIPCLTCSRFNNIEDRHTGAGNSRLSAEKDIISGIVAERIKNEKNDLYTRIERY